MSRSMFPLALMILLVTALARPAAAAAPSLVAKDPVFNFGKIFQGEKIQHTFSIRNAGDAPLVIGKIKTSCGCTAALLSEKNLLPGKEGEVTATFDSDRFRGSIKKTIYLYSNDPSQAVTKLFIQGEVEPEILVRPEVIQLGVRSAGEVIETEIQIFNSGNERLILKGVETTSKEVEAKASATTISPGQTGVIQVTARPGKGSERINAYVLVETDNPRKGMLRIPVFAQVTD